ncbi:MAG: hypothetical protein J07HX5_01709 [halophilic archaeon J07HX5]|jgi:hypothetical protein|nr:MAG: hypothetical protein J07HX5_01709 [halophilic archaeon J07HX5]
MTRTPSRRSLLALAASAAIGSTAGCLGSIRGGSSGQAGFRDWLTDPDVFVNEDWPTIGFSYTEDTDTDHVSKSARMTAGRMGISDVPLEADVNAYLSQWLGSILILFGEFSRLELEIGVENSENAMITGERGPYRIGKRPTLTNTESDRDEIPFAFNENVIISSFTSRGSFEAPVERCIDSKTGDTDGLEAAYPVFTQLFDRLPDLSEQTWVSGMSKWPSLWDDLDGFDANVLSVPESGTDVVRTAVFAFDDTPTEKQTQIIKQRFDSVIENADKTTTDGRFLTITGTGPEIPSAPE